jgi:hypothetical protein
VLLTIADSMSYAGAASASGRGGCTVVVSPVHATLLAEQGWTKGAVKQFLWQHWGRSAGELKRFGLLAARDAARAGEAFIHFGASPESLVVVVAGANNGGVSTVIPGQALVFSQAVGGARAPRATGLT